MTAKEFAEKYVGQVVELEYYGVKDMVRVVGYLPTELTCIVDIHTRLAVTKMSRSQIGYAIGHTFLDSGKYDSGQRDHTDFHMGATKFFNLPKDMPTINPSHYPHRCPRCSKPSYNRMYGGFDCSAGCK